MNWKLRFQNPATLTALIAALVAFVYQVLSIMGITTTIDQSFFVQLGGVVVTLLVALGVIVDPTTAGIEDSEKALSYEKPKNDKDTPTPQFSATDFDKFINTTEDHFINQSTNKFIKVWGQTVYWGTEIPQTGKDGDIWLDRANNDMIRKWQNGKWQQTNQYAIVSTE